MTVLNLEFIFSGPSKLILAKYYNAQVDCQTPATTSQPNPGLSCAGGDKERYGMVAAVLKGEGVLAFI